MAKNTPMGIYEAEDKFNELRERITAACAIHDQATETSPSTLTSRAERIREKAHESADDTVLGLMKKSYDLALNTAEYSIPIPGTSERALSPKGAEFLITQGFIPPTLIPQGLNPQQAQNVLRGPDADLFTSDLGNYMDTFTPNGFQNYLKGMQKEGPLFNGNGELITGQDVIEAAVGTTCDTVAPPLFTPKQEGLQGQQFKVPGRFYKGQ